MERKRDNVRQLSARNVIAACDGNSVPWLTVTVQRPQSAGDSKQWNSYVNSICHHLNIAAEADAAELSARACEAVSNLDPGAVQCGGWAIYCSAEQTTITRLADTPRTLIRFGRRPLVLPTAVSQSARPTGWVLAIDRDHPGFYRFDGSELVDETDRIDFDSFAKLRNVRETDAAVDHHSASSAADNGEGAEAKFHALGAAAEDVEEVEVREFLKQLGSAIKPLIAGTGEPLILAGDPKRRGWMREVLKLPELREKGIDAAGSALEPEVLQAEVQRYFDGLAREVTAPLCEQLGSTTSETHIPSIADAAHTGRVDTLLVERGHGGLCHANGERLEPEVIDDDDEIVALDEIVFEVISNGGKVTPVDQSIWSASAPAAAILRY